MSHREYALGPSRILAALLVAGHAAAGAAVVVLQPGAAWLAVAGGALAISLALELRSAALRRGRGSVVALRAGEEGSLQVRLREGAWRDCELLGSSCVTAWLTIVNLRRAGERRVRSAVILPDSLDAEAYRALRAWLRWRARPA